jgi:hypothetical protein
MNLSVIEAAKVDCGVLPSHQRMSGAAPLPSGFKQKFSKPYLYIWNTARMGSSGFPVPIAFKKGRSSISLVLRGCHQGTSLCLLLSSAYHNMNPLTLGWSPSVVESQQTGFLFANSMHSFMFIIPRGLNWVRGLNYFSIFLHLD